MCSVLGVHRQGELQEQGCTVTDNADVFLYSQLHLSPRTGGTRAPRPLHSSQSYQKPKSKSDSSLKDAHFVFPLEARGTQMC